LPESDRATIKTVERAGKSARTRGGDVIELVRTNDLVTISFVETLLRQAAVAFLVADQHMSSTEGSLGFLPRRILVADHEEARARRLLREAGLAHELRDG
jgi:hypothetical protein